jgi:hypothetical protein
MTQSQEDKYNESTFKLPRGPSGYACAAEAEAEHAPVSAPVGPV